MEEEKTVTALLEFVRRTDEINKRLVFALVAIVACMCILMGTIAVSYFTSDYGYSTAMTNISSDNNTNSIGSEK